MSDAKKSISVISPLPSPIVVYTLPINHHISYDDYNGRCLKGGWRTAKEEAAEATIGTALACTYAFVSYCIGVSRRSFSTYPMDQQYPVCRHNWRCRRLHEYYISVAYEQERDISRTRASDAWLSVGDELGTLDSEPQV